MLGFKQYNFSIQTSSPYNSKLEDRSSAEYRLMIYEATTLVGSHVVKYVKHAMSVSDTYM